MVAGHDRKLRTRGAPQNKIIVFVIENGLTIKKHHFENKTDH